ncbi:phosphotransferase enzyme family protein [Amniculicola lignicola CBS 123094]|uniref:Phosphotransferase enzyme family protein n=1 Tax=Amniculicola lignicola CBS 123094 TaxID=1392246 RepID=A0A6A5WXG6_9PLEO|nr:phosphotransferase enzyme family protein [Amniculicola lignicola CBS 123094]
MSPTITPEDIPKAANFDVRTSSFFQHHTQLPSPEEVRSQAKAQREAGTHWGWKERGVSGTARPSPAVFEEMSLFVKWGRDIKIAEGQVLYAIRESCGNSVPVPEIYGWRTDGTEAFLYMEAIQGKTLDNEWPEMKEGDRLRICSELKTILRSLRQIKQDPNDIFIGNITRSRYFERALFLESQVKTGPFLSVKDFHDWFIHQYKRRLSRADQETIPEPYRQDLPDTSRIVFTHGDLHQSNVIISSSPSGPPQVAAVIDWEQSGWLPDYWEDCKAHWTVLPSSEWAQKYLPLIMKKDEKIQEAWSYYTDPVGCGC